MPLTVLRTRLVARSTRVVAFTTIVGGTALLSPVFHPDPYAVLVTARVSGGSVMEVFFNDFSAEPLRAPVVPGDTAVYEFRPWADAVTRLRLDPAKAAGVEVRLLRVDILRGSGLAATFPADALARWTCDGLVPSPDRDGALLSASDDPTCVSPVLDLPRPDFTVLGAAIPAGPLHTGLLALVILAALVFVLHVGAWLLAAGGDQARPPPGAPSRLSVVLRAEVPLALAYMAIAAVLTLRLGQDMSYDLRAYHFYNPYAFLSDRIERDVYAAQYQSYLNPLLHLPPFIAMHVWRLPPAVVGAALGAFHGLALWGVHRLVAALLRRRPPAVQWTLGGAAAVTSALGAGFQGELGTWMGDNTLSVFVLGALLALLAGCRRDAIHARRWFACSGLLAGVAFGGKLVAGPYAVGLAVAGAAARGPWQERARRLLWIGAGVLAGTIVTGGYWAWLMYRQFDSPVFPLFNAVFASAYASADAPMFLDPEYPADDLFRLLLLPFFFRSSAVPDTAPAFQDLRMAAAWVVLAALGVRRLMRRNRGAAGAGDPLAPLAVFAAAGYALWLGVFAIYRFVIPIELLAPAIVIGGLARLVRRTLPLVIAALAVCVVLVATGRPADWGRAPWSDSPFGVDRAEFEPYAGATMLLWGGPNAYLAPYFPASTIFVRPSQADGGPNAGTLMAARVTRRVEEAAALYALETLPERPRGRDDFLRSHSLTRDRTACRLIRTRADTHRICAIRRVPPG